MPRKSFEAGMEDGAKPFEEKFKKQADAIEKVGARLDSRLDEISGVMDVMMDDLSAQERKRVYDLNTVVDISELDDTEKEYLCSILYALANLNSQLAQLQKDYLRSLKSYLKVVNVQSDVSLESIENIDNITTQKAIMQTIMEFLFLEYENHDYMDDYEDVFDYFSVNRKGVREIQAGIDTIYKTVGLDGIAEHYGSTKKVTIIQDANLSKADLDLRKKAEEAYLRYDIRSAFPLFSLLAEQGDGRSCYFLGQIYESAYSGVTNRDTEKAKCFLEKGKIHGDILCSLKLAETTEETPRKTEIYAENFDAVLALAQGGDIYAMFELARLYDSRYGEIKNEEQAIYWYKQSAEAGFWGAFNNLGLLYDAKEEYDVAASYYKKAVDIGYDGAMCNLAYCYLYGIGVDEDKEKADSLFKMAANGGNRNAQCRLGAECIVNEEYVEARRLLNQAVNNGNIKAYYYLAELEERDNTDAHFEREVFMLNGKTSTGVDAFDDPNAVSIGARERKLCNLLLGTHHGDNAAQIELAHKCTGFLGGWTIWTWLDKSGFLDLIGYEITFGTQKFKIHLSEEREIRFMFGGTANGKELPKDKEKELRNMAIEVLETFAEDGNPAAQYYLGMDYAKKYEYSSKDTDKRMAVKWLRECYDNVWAPNLDRTLKCLNKFVVVNWPPCDNFVGGCFVTL